VPGQLTEWPLRCGPVPPLADTSSPRPETGLGLVGKLAPGDTLILTPAGQPGSPHFPEHGGSGKTQLAAALAHGLWDNRSVDLLVWVGAASRDAILSGYVSALADLGAADPDDDLLASAQRFLTWLSRTDRRWVMVLDDLADPADLDGLWPFGTDGRVVVTARQEESLDGPNRRVVQVSSFTMREALAYLTARLSTDPGQRTEALDLATDLDRQPLALAHATAALICTGASCRDYRGWFHDRRRRLGPPATDAEPGVIDVTWSLAMDLADQIAPTGFARPMLALAALLDPAGIPGVVFTSQAACGYMTGHPAMPGDPAQAREAVHNLARAGLVTINPASTTRTVQVHPLIQALTRKVIPAAEFERAARSAADALYQAWPGQDVPPRLAQALRDCTTRLRDCTGDLLWTPEAHPVLLRAGESLSEGHISGPAAAYWLAMLDTAARVLGPAHAQTLRCRDGLAGAYEAADRLDDAIGVHERTLADRQQALGNDHPDTLASCAHLGRVYAAAGRHGEALPMYEQTLADLDRALGAAHPDTLNARAGLAHAYQTAGQLKQAVPAFERTLAEREKAQGPDHPDTISARADLAYAYRSADRMKHAIPQYERVVGDRERVLGTYHPDTLTARGNLANAYLAARRLKDALPVYERALADREMAQGTDDVDTLTARGNLANAYHSAGRLKDALPLYEQTLLDCERVLGPTHQATLTSRANLGSAYHAALRLTEAVNVFERTLADCEQALGPDHPLTKAVRENLDAANRT
jgi:tetratricopeptide (TPR) repeat protein